MCSQGPSQGLWFPMPNASYQLIFRFTVASSPFVLHCIALYCIVLHCIVFEYLYSALNSLWKWAGSVWKSNLMKIINLNQIKLLEELKFISIHYWILLYCLLRTMVVRRQSFTTVLIILLKGQSLKLVECRHEGIALLCCKDQSCSPSISTVEHSIIGPI